MNASLPLDHSIPHVVYLVHFEPGLRNRRHYLGITACDQYSRRMRAHANGYGSRILRAAFKQQSRMFVTRLWPDATYALERSLKNRGHMKKLCPLCKSADQGFVAQPLQELITELGPLGAEASTALSFPPSHS